MLLEQYINLIIIQIINKLSLQHKVLPTKNKTARL
jgi:hypothetical protein